tara:strand:- start:358 stop:786 length:429 start_codon:yes stop_codon:yes gene_type:complete
MKMRQVVVFEDHEVELIRQAIGPWRVMVKDKADEEDLRIVFQAWLNSMHLDFNPGRLVRLRDTLKKLCGVLEDEAYEWQRHAEGAPPDALITNPDAAPLILKPRAAYLMLVDTRNRQAENCSDAIKLVNYAIELLPAAEEEE